MLQVGSAIVVASDGEVMTDDMGGFIYEPSIHAEDAAQIFADQDGHAIGAKPRAMLVCIATRIFEKIPPRNYTHEHFDQLTDEEKSIVGEAFKAATATLREWNGELKIAGDDRAERVVNAIARGILESRNA